MIGDVELHGSLAAKKIGARKAPLSWRLRNMLRWAFVWGWFVNLLGKALSKVTGLVTLTSELHIRVRKADGTWIDYGIASFRLVTDAAVAYIVDDWDGGAQIIDNFNYHECGTGSTAESAAQTALVTPCTTVLNPDSTRATGTKTQPSANIMQTVGTLTFDGAAAVVEHGVFSAASTGTLLDRSLFTAVNVVSGDSIQFTYALTLNSGG